MSSPIKAFCLLTITLHGRAEVRRSLERLLNAGHITVADARIVWRAAFGGDLLAVPAR